MNAPCLSCTNDLTTCINEFLIFVCYNYQWMINSYPWSLGIYHVSLNSSYVLLSHELPRCSKMRQIDYVAMDDSYVYWCMHYPHGQTHVWYPLLIKDVVLIHESSIVLSECFWCSSTNCQYASATSSYMVLINDLYIWINESIQYVLELCIYINGSVISNMYQRIMNSY